VSGPLGATLPVGVPPPPGEQAPALVTAVPVRNTPQLVSPFPLSENVVHCPVTGTSARAVVPLQLLGASTATPHVDDVQPHVPPAGVPQVQPLVEQPRVSFTWPSK